MDLASQPTMKINDHNSMNNKANIMKAIFEQSPALDFRLMLEVPGKSKNEKRIIKHCWGNSKLA